MPFSRFEEWAECGLRLCQDSPTLAACYFNASHGTLQKLRARHVEAWAMMGRRLVQGHLEIGHPGLQVLRLQPEAGAVARNRGPRPVRRVPGVRLAAVVRRGDRLHRPWVSASSLPWASTTRHTSRCPTRSRRPDGGRSRACSTPRPGRCRGCRQVSEDVSLPCRTRCVRAAPATLRVRCWKFPRRFGSSTPSTTNRCWRCRKT